MTRRDFVASGAGCAAGGVLGAGSLSESSAHGAAESTSPRPSPPRGEGELTARPSVYETIGVKHVVNATGTVTVLGGSVMPPEVVAAWMGAAKYFVDLVELQDKVGQKIAQLVDVEAALVTTGAAGAVLLGTAAAVTRGDADRIRRLPDTNGMKNEVVLQKTHHSCYDNQLTDVGVRLVDVVTRDELERTVNERTALMFFMNYADRDGQVQRQQWIEVARRRNVPTLLDAAADVPPIGRLSEYNKMGFDMVAFSGGKALAGPNDTGLLLGRRDLIEAAKRNTNPYCGTIGRMMKVSKEDMIACLAAVERYVRTDHAAQWREWERSLTVIEEALRDIPTLRTERVVPPLANHVPHLVLAWDESRVKTTPAQVTEELAGGDPCIRIGRVRDTGSQGICVSVFMLQQGEDRVVAARLREILRAAVEASAPL